jgi:CubicO group peptidase (beta-lactamase class C family)
MRLIPSLAFLLAPVLCSAEVSFPQSTPEAEGFSRARLEAVKDHLAARHTRALLIVRHGKIVYEWYAPGNGPSQTQGTASMAKALVGGMSLLVALNDGLMHVDDFAAQYIPAWRQDPLKSKITIRHLATHSSGIEDAEQDNKPHEDLPGWKGDFWKRKPDPFSIAIHQAPVIFPPGARFEYSNPGMAALAYAVTASLKGRPQTDIRALLRERIVQPLEIPETDWSIGYGQAYELDGLRLYANWGGGRFTPRATARIGQLMLQEGQWRGRQLVRQEWARTMVRGVEPLPRMGLCWWTNLTAVWPKVPPDAFRGGGAGNQLLLVIPSLDLIIVRNGEWLERDNPDAEAVHVYNPVLQALVP